jgi:nucleotide-binding universal stress UspA family protein
MYRHILIPTDGSELAEHAVTNGLLLAKSVGAKVTVIIAEDPFDWVSVSENARPYQAIIAAASDRGCDLIVMGSHGRGGLAAVVLGSVTTKVLTHTKTPVLVYR